MKNKKLIMSYCLLSLLTTPLKAAEDGTLDSEVIDQSSSITVMGKEQYGNSKLINNDAKVITTSEDNLTKGMNSTVQDLLKNLPGVNTGVTGPGEIDIRGQGGSARYNVQVLLNGMPLNFLRSHRNFPGYNIIPASSVKQVDLIAGGGAVIYGNGTQGGVINLSNGFMIDDNSPNDISFGVGSYSSNTRGLNLKDKSLLNGKLTLGLIYSGSNNKQYLKGEYSNTDYYDLSIKYNITDDHVIGYSFSEYLEDGKASGPVPIAEVNKNWRASADLADSDRNMVSNQIIYKGTIGNVEIFNNAFLTKTDWKSKHNYENKAPIWSNNTGNKLQAKVNYLSNGSFLLLGNDIIRTAEVVSQNSAYGRGIGDDAQFDKTTIALFALNKTYFHNFYSTQGFRYNHDDWKREGNIAPVPKGQSSKGRATTKRDDTNYAYEFSVGHEGEYNNTWAKMEAGFTAPSPLSFLNTVNKYYVSNNIKYENFINYEIGNKIHIGDNLGISTVLFYTDTKDEVGSKAIGNYYEESYNFNIGRTSRKGIELEVNYKMFNNILEIFANGTYVDAKLEKANEKALDKFKGIISDENIKEVINDLRAQEGKKLLSVPNLSFVIGAVINVTDNIAITNTVNYLGKYYKNDAREVALGDRALYDIDVKYTQSKYDVSLGVKNAFNKKYYATIWAADAENPTSVFPAMGRYVYANVKYKF